MAYTRISQSVSGTAVTIGVGAVHHGPLGILLGGIVSQTAGISVLARDAVAAAGGLHRVPLARLRHVAAAYRQFPLLATGSALLNNVGLTLPPLLLAAFYTPQAAGLFGMAQRVVSLPMALVGSSVSQVFLGEAARVLRDAPLELPRLFGRVTRKLAVLSIAVAAVGLLSPVLFPLAFGVRWREAGVYAALMAAYCAPQIVTSPISTVVVVAKRQDVQIALDAARALLVVLSLWIPHMLRLPPLVAVVCYSATMACTYGVSWLVYVRIARRAGEQRAALAASLPAGDSGAECGAGGRL